MQLSAGCSSLRSATGGALARWALTVAALALAAGTAAAAPVSFLAGALAATSGSFAGGFAQQASATYSALSDPDSSVHEKADSAANLADGSVRVGIENIATNSSQTQAAVAMAVIGDSFSHSSETGPFAWTSDTEARFKVHLDGSTSLVPGTGEVFNIGYVALIIFRPGTLDDSLPFCGTDVMMAFFWSVGALPLAAPCGEAFLGHIEGTVDQDLVASFMPGGDFDWAFIMQVGGVFNYHDPAGSGSGSWIDDFSHTATLSYTAPAGATVQSGSGVFPGTTAADVPEPGTLALIALGAFGLGWQRQRSRSQGDLRFGTDGV